MPQDDPGFKYNQGDWWTFAERSHFVTKGTRTAICGKFTWSWTAPYPTTKKCKACLRIRGEEHEDV